MLWRRTRCRCVDFDGLFMIDLDAAVAARMEALGRKVENGDTRTGVT